ncbi:aminotransferase class IV [uncultured Paludibaculum sp.]|uniref:aminotransferase class IV n=1 Tax=uncultured Paludibaculum sp. TaxID=1765020 RepID=UPI002AAB3A7C|nr:aminotransferase class IV [uncultured Paludibaculum sp.]
MIRPKLLHNGQIRSSSDLILNPGQVGLLSGWGIFSTIKVVDGVLFEFNRHWARMSRDADLLRVPFPWSAVELEEMLIGLVEANQDFNSTLRVAVVRNTGTMWSGPITDPEFDLIAFTAARSNWGGACKLGIVPNARHAACVFTGTKTTSWAMNLVWYEEAHRRGLDEVILLNERGEVSECTSANVFACFGDTAVTPPLSSGCLPGITRQLLVERVQVPGIQVTESVISLDDLERADGIFITSSTRDLLPVAEVEGLSIQTGDRVRKSLAEALERHQAAYVALAIRRAAVGIGGVS